MFSPINDTPYEKNQQLQTIPLTISINDKSLLSVELLIL